MTRRLLAVLVSVSAFAGPVAAQTTETPTYPALVAGLEQAVLAGEPEAYLSLLSPAADRAAAMTFAREQLYPNVERATISPRFRIPIDDLPQGTGYELTVEVFSEAGMRGRLETWQLEIVREEDDTAWRIRDQTHIDSLDDLRHLTLTPTTQYTADNMVVLGEDLSLTLTEGSVFVAETEDGVTGLVLLGEGIMSFTPQPEAERGQVRIFSGDETLEAEFEAAFVRVHPEVFNSRVSTSGLVEQAVDPDMLRKATAVFEEFIGLSFTLDLSTVSDRLWSLSPGVGDFLAEVRTKRHGTLTYAQSAQQAEDISLHERATSRIISLYSSARKRATQGRYFGDDDVEPLDVLDYDITASFEPLGVTQRSYREAPQLIGCRIVGTTRLAVRVKGLPIAAFGLRLADELEVLSITSNELGPLLFFRLIGQNNVVVNLPAEVPGGTEFTITVNYAGDLRAQQLEESWIATRVFVLEAEGLFGVGEPRYVYSNRSYWYPQARVTDYATATMELTAPPGWGIVASGNPLDTNPPVTRSLQDGPGQFSFVALQPARYLSALISRFKEHASPVRQVQLTEEVVRPAVTRADGAVFYDTLAIDVQGSPRSIEEIEAIADQTADIASFYASLLGDIPYPTMTVALTDSRLPGGHSPAYFAVMNHELPRQPGILISWQTDPVSFSSYPPFFLAHEIAHQWWGQAVGWKNYHEQWLSEGMAHYFAALYAEQDGGPEVFSDILRQMRRWAMRHSDEGPIYLGYRLGHLDGETRVFRALVYNKGAMVLHMLRGLTGDDAFFAGLRRFYHQWRFQKAGTDALQLAFEIEAGRSLDRFFDRWIHEAELPELRFSSHTEATPSGEVVVLRFEQLTERLFDLPVTVDLTYRSGEEEAVVVPVTEQVTEVRVPARGRVRRVRVNRDDVALAEIDR
ncbi:MAG TPA: M1 family aminopeptidase [Vicinamibacterales bacterium]|nr:M1 family aminopeptidase [Vicinamibacterales bacterium]